MLCLKRLIGHATHTQVCVCRSTSEVAGVGAESSLLRFVRQHFQGAVSLPTGGGTSLFLQASGGALVPWGHSWQKKQTCISDRYALFPSQIKLSSAAWGFSIAEQCCYEDMPVWKQAIEIHA